MNQQVKDEEQKQLERALDRWPEFRHIMLEQLLRAALLIDVAGPEPLLRAGRVCGIAKQIQEIDNKLGGATNG